MAPQRNLARRALPHGCFIPEHRSAELINRLPAISHRSHASDHEPRRPCFSLRRAHGRLTHRSHTPPHSPQHPLRPGEEHQGVQPPGPATTHTKRKQPALNLLHGPLLSPSRPARHHTHPVLPSKLIWYEFAHIGCICWVHEAAFIGTQ
jgi:hypothetical protein